MDRPIDGGFGNHRIFEQCEPSPGIDLGSDDEGSRVLTLFEDAHQRGGFFMGIVS